MHNARESQCESALNDVVQTLNTMEILNRRWSSEALWLEKDLVYWVGSDTVDSEIAKTKSIPVKAESCEETMYWEMSLYIQQDEDI